MRYNDTVVFNAHPGLSRTEIFTPLSIMNYNHPPVLIVGAGPVVRIIDKDPNPHIGQRAPGIWPRTLELFNFLDVPEVNDLGTQFPAIRTYKFGIMEPASAGNLESSPEGYLMFTRTKRTPAIPFNVPKLLGQELLEVILRRHLEKHSCFVETGTELRSFKQSDEQVTVVLATKRGDDEILETLTTKWIIGADGAKGVVRKQLGLTFSGETRDHFHIVTGDIRLTGAELDRTYWHRFGGFDSRALSLLPRDEVGDDGWQFFFLGPDLDMGKIAQSEELVFETIASMLNTEITFNKLIWATDYRPNIRIVDKFSEGRIFVAGDAAHVHPPTGAQGLNSGVQDAFNLGWKLALVEKGLAEKSLLETYNTERLPVISEMIELTASMLDTSVKMGSSKWNNSLFMLGIHYRFSNIVLDEFATPVEVEPINAYRALDEGYLEAGDRAPDAPKLFPVHPRKSDVTTLFSLYRPWHHTVLIFVPNPADATPILAALEQYDKSIVQSAVILPLSAPTTPFASTVDFVLLDQEGHAYSAYLLEITQTKVFVIRLDGVIGAIVRGAEGVKKYFSKILWEM